MVMNAIVWTKYGPPDVLQLQQVEKPAPKDNEVLIKIIATTVTAGDCEMRALKLPMMLGLPMRLYAGMFKPSRLTILGQELAGIVETVGRDVTRFKPGDRVFAATGFGLGGYAEFICLRADSEDVAMALMPANMTYDEAAGIPVGGLEALHFLRQAHIQPGERVLINGAGGSIGTVGIQLAKLAGAEVTGVDSTAKLETLRSIGADHVIDYTQQDFTQNGEHYDVIFDVVGKASFADSLESLAPTGRYLIGNPTVSSMIKARRASSAGGKQVIVGAGNQRSEDLVYLRERIESGELRSVIDRRYPLAQTAEAHRYVESGQKTGNVIITVGSAK